MVGYYKGFVEGFSKLALPITRLICNNPKFEWPEECEQSFQGLKKRLVSAPVLAFPERIDGFMIFTDA